ncbi:MAG: DUF1801 domain-containing protein [Pyrinomonadaceae bacterium]
MSNMNATEQITSHINELSGWRGKMLARLRTVILDATPGLVEEWKWNTPVWSHNGNVVAIGAFQDHVKVNFFKGASLSDPKGIFNAGLEAKASRAIDIHEGDTLNEAALKELVCAAVALNSAKPKPSTTQKKKGRS